MTDHLKPADREGLAREVLAKQYEADGMLSYARLAREGGSNMASIIAAMLEFAALPPGAERVERYRHVKRGTEYAVVGTASLQIATGDLVDGSDLIVYRGDDGKLWAREEGEFHDGRFEKVNTPATPAEQPDQRAGEVERVAEAIYVSSVGLDNDPTERLWAETGEGTKNNFRRHARNALAALHPSQESHGVEGEVERLRAFAEAYVNAWEAGTGTVYLIEQARAALGKEGA